MCVIHERLHDSTENGIALKNGRNSFEIMLVRSQCLLAAGTWSHGATKQKKNEVHFFMCAKHNE